MRRSCAWRGLGWRMVASCPLGPTCKRTILRALGHGNQRQMDNCTLQIHGMPCSFQHLVEVRGWQHGSTSLKSPGLQWLRGKQPMERALLSAGHTFSHATNMLRLTCKHGILCTSLQPANARRLTCTQAGMAGILGMLYWLKAKVGHTLMLSTCLSKATS